MSSLMKSFMYTVKIFTGATAVCRSPDWKLLQERDLPEVRPHQGQGIHHGWDRWVTLTLVNNLIVLKHIHIELCTSVGHTVQSKMFCILYVRAEITFYIYISYLDDKIIYIFLKSTSVTPRTKRTRSLLSWATPRWFFTQPMIRKKNYQLSAHRCLRNSVEDPVSGQIRIQDSVNQTKGEF